jgi:serine/threonine protein kinase
MIYMMSSSKPDNQDVFSTAVVSGDYNSASGNASQQENTAISQPPGLIGSMLQGRYRLLEIIDQGGMGQILKAIQEPMGREVAIKIMKAPQEQDAEKRFFREAAITSKLQHPNTVRIYDYGKEGEGTENEVIFIAMELLRGKSLRDEIRDGPIEPLRCTRIYRQICGALGEAHQQGMIHRDIKPSNIFMTSEDGNFPKLLDFGLVKDMDGESTELTKTGMVLGSPMYMSPEQVKSEKVSVASDIYSLGMSMYHTLSGCTPFEGEFTAIMMAQILKMPEKIDVRMQSLFAAQNVSLGENILDDLQNKETQVIDSKIITEQIEQFHLPFEIPEILEWVIFTAIQKEPKDRFSSVYQFRQALEICEEVLIKRTDSPEYNLTLSLENGQLIRSDGKSMTTGSEVSSTMVFRPQPPQKSNTKSQNKGVLTWILGLIVVLGAVFMFQYFKVQFDTDKSETKKLEVASDVNINDEHRNPTSPPDSKGKLEVRISSVPSKATVFMTDINDEKMVVGKTPFLMSLKLSEIKFLEIEMKGYLSQKILPSLSNSEFEITLEQIKKDRKKKTKVRKPTKSQSSKKNKEGQEEGKESPDESNKKPVKKGSGELKDPWE